MASFDGVPLDADVTLPATGNGPWPTIVLLHGLGGNKTALQSNVAPIVGIAPVVLPNLTHYNNVYYARRGYAVLAYTSRGFGESCGGNGTPAAYAQLAPCNRGFIRLADQRYEARDSQHLLGLLADQGIVQPTKIGVTGFSYGGGMAAQLGALKDKIRLPNGTFAPWRSPKGTPMAIGAAYSQWGWYDLIASLLPNGRFLDYKPGSVNASVAPVGVMVQSYVRALFILAATEGYIVAPQTPIGPDNSQWDLITAIRLMEQGEPYGAQLTAIARSYRKFHGSWGIPGTPAPLLLEDGWNDDIFTPQEALRMYTKVRADKPKAFVSLLLGDLGHGRDANRARVNIAFNNAASAFFDEHLKGVERPGRPVNRGVIAYEFACPGLGANAVPDPGPFRAASWEKLHPFALQLSRPGRRIVLSTGGDPNVGNNFDPIPQTNPQGTVDPCKTIPATDAAGTAVYRKKLRRGIQMMGFPTIKARISTVGRGGQLAARLWDVDNATNRQRLISRGVYRLTDNQKGFIAFQLHGNGYRFAKGHTVKMEIGPSDAPYYRASSGGAFRVAITKARVILPLRSRSRG